MLNTECESLLLHSEELRPSLLLRSLKSAPDLSGRQIFAALSNRPKAPNLLPTPLEQQWV